MEEPCGVNSLQLQPKRKRELHFSRCHYELVDSSSLAKFEKSAEEEWYTSWKQYDLQYNIIFNMASL